MKTLVIASQYPLPETGGNRIRTMNFVRYFKKHGDVDLAYYQDTAPNHQPDPLFCHEFPLIQTDSPEKSNRLEDLYEQFRYSKPWIVCSYSRKTTQQLIDIIELGNYDQIVCRYAVSAFPLFFLSQETKGKVIIDLDDLMTPDLYQAVHGILPGIRKIRSFLDMGFYRKFQINCSRIGKTLVCSDADRKLILKDAPDAAVHVVPNVAPALALPENYTHEGYANLDTLLFVGNLAYPPNVAGLEWFITSIFNRFRTTSPDIKLLVVGKDPDARVRAACTANSQIELIENPADIVPFYDQCGVVIVPLLSGGGTRIKILEAGLASRPIISTDIGAYGLSLKNRYSFLSMQDYDSFKASYDWLRDRDNYTRMVHSMLRFVESKYTVKNFEDALDTVLGTTENKLTEQYTPGLVSVIVPVYNRADLVGKTIESILAQTYRKIEIIAVNDGSTDGSLELLHAYSARYPGKMVVVDQQNTGQVRARNVGIQHAKGEFIAFLDSDDTWEREKLALQIPLFKSGVGLVYCAIKEVDQDNRVIRTVPCENGLRGSIYHELLIRNRMTGGSVVVSRKALDRVGLFDEALRAAENWDLWIRIARDFKVDYVSSPLVQYLKHSNNISSNNQLMTQASWALLQKHLPPAADKGDLRQTYALAYANFHYNQGVMHFGAGEYQQARRSFMYCWRYKPFYRDSAVRMLRSLMGKGINQLLSDRKSVV